MDHKENSGHDDSVRSRRWEAPRKVRVCNNGGVRGFAGACSREHLGWFLRWLMVRAWLHLLSLCAFFDFPPFADFSCSADSFGLVAYPKQSVKRSIQRSFHQRTRVVIVASLYDNGRDLAKQWTSRGFQEGVVLGKFQSRSREGPSDYDSDYVQAYH